MALLPLPSSCSGKTFRQLAQDGSRNICNVRHCIPNFQIPKCGIDKIRICFGNLCSASAQPRHRLQQGTVMNNIQLGFCGQLLCCDVDVSCVSPVTARFRYRKCTTQTSGASSGDPARHRLTFREVLGSLSLDMCEQLGVVTSPQTLNHPNVSSLRLRLCLSDFRPNIHHAEMANYTFQLPSRHLLPLFHTLNRLEASLTKHVYTHSITHTVKLRH
ncbi:hypothetical protein F2P81_017411 [Scophthalmus maximus]|uniref:Uncharacterized protein n=1 Tax=Scophthalmus maximus TaxID=52904 RepID=A0A6A4SFP3_SCOMX|nr:hypothetical protein F2P81_017411 [Scophthalmus maximus]